MDTRTPSAPGDSVAVAVTLLTVQAAILVTGVIETWVFASFVGPGALGALIVTGSVATTALAAAWGVARGSTWARRLALTLEGVIVAVAIVDVIVAPILVGAGITLVPFLSRVLLPVAVIAILRRPMARAWFGATTVAA